MSGERQALTARDAVILKVVTASLCAGRQLLRLVGEAPRPDDADDLGEALVEYKKCQRGLEALL